MTTYNLEFVTDQVFFAARDGMFVSLISILDSMNYCDVEAVLNRVSSDGLGQFGPPLVIAARNGFEKIVNILVNKYHADTEQEGSVKIDNSLVEGASPLWCAAAAGYLSVVKLLVKAGANVNHTTRSQSTPVRAACFNGRLDIVRYLVEHGADVNRPNKYNSSCLMIACYKGHSDIVKFLLERGVDVYQKAHCGSSAMHFAAECGHLDIVKLLINSGVKMQVNSNGMTPLMSAAERTRINVVEFLLKQDDVTKREKIDALELLGASFANDKDNYSLDLCYVFLRRAMLLRFEDTDDLYPKIECAEVNPAYGQRVECRNLTELEAIREDSDALHMESLVIRERILGQRNPDVAHSVIFRGAVYADHMRFGKCVPLWLHGLYLSRINKCFISRDLLRFSQVFSQMYSVDIPIQFDYMKTVLEAALEELARLKVKIADPENVDDVSILMDEMEISVINTLYLITIMTKIKNKLSVAEIFTLEQLIFNILKVGAVTRNGYTLLHLSVDGDTPVDPFHTDDVCRFPCADTAIQLIKCGADVDAMDYNRNTPLHVIVSHSRPVSDFVTVQSIIYALLDANCHCDIVNSAGLTPIEAASSVADIFEKQMRRYRFNLKCLTSKVINTYDIPYVGIVPKEMEEYIELHGCASLSVKYRKCGSGKRVGCFAKK